MTMNLMLHQKNGFTLVETLIAVAILVAAVTGPLSTAARSVVDSRHANDQIAGYYLAQEVIEVIRSIRDNNSFASVDWMTGIPAACVDNNSDPSDIPPVANQCVLDAQTRTITPCVGSCPALQFVDTGTGGEVRTFGQGMAGGAENSIYTRTFTITTLPATDPLRTLDEATEVALRVRITWLDNGVARSFVLGENLFDWK